MQMKASHSVPYATNVFVHTEHFKMKGIEVSDKMKLIDEQRKKDDETTAKKLGQAYCYCVVAP